MGSSLIHLVKVCLPVLGRPCLCFTQQGSFMCPVIVRHRLVICASLWQAVIHSTQSHPLTCFRKHATLRLLLCCQGRTDPLKGWLPHSILQCDANYETASNGEQ